MAAYGQHLRGRPLDQQGAMTQALHNFHGQQLALEDAHRNYQSGASQLYAAAGAGSNPNSFGSCGSVPPFGAKPSPTSGRLARQPWLGLQASIRDHGQHIEALLLAAPLMYLNRSLSIPSGRKFRHSRASLGNGHRRARAYGRAPRLRHGRLWPSSWSGSESGSTCGPTRQPLSFLLDPHVRDAFGGRPSWSRPQRQAPSQSSQPRGRHAPASTGWWLCGRPRAQGPISRNMGDSQVQASMSRHFRRRLMSTQRAGNWDMAMKFGRLSEDTKRFGLAEAYKRESELELL